MSARRLRFCVCCVVCWRQALTRHTLLDRNSGNKTTHRLSLSSLSAGNELPFPEFERIAGADIDERGQLLAAPRKDGAKDNAAEARGAQSIDLQEYAADGASGGSTKSLLGGKGAPKRDVILQDDRLKSLAGTGVDEYGRLVEKAAAELGGEAHGVDAFNPFANANAPEGYKGSVPRAAFLHARPLGGVMVTVRWQPVNQCVCHLSLPSHPPFQAGRLGARAEGRTARLGLHRARARRARPGRGAAREQGAARRGAQGAPPASR